MKRSTLIFTMAGILLIFLGCEQGKSGPFTFTNKTENSVNVLITQDETVEQTLNAGSSYTGKNYFTPKITFVKGIDTDANKKIIDNRFVATTDNGFDYIFETNPGSDVSIGLQVSDDFKTTYPNYGNWYLKEVNGKLGDYSSQSMVTFEELLKSPQAPNGVPTKLYTDTPEFRVYNDKGVDLTSSFTVNLEKGDISPGIWTLEIIYPKMEEIL